MMVKHSDGWLVIESGPEEGMINLSNVDCMWPDENGNCVVEYCGETEAVILELTYEEVKEAIANQGSDW